jgi:hypothetical protein
VAVSRLLLLDGNFNIFEKKKADYQVLWLAFFAFYKDKINLFVLELRRVKIKNTPTYLENSSSRKFQIAKLYLRVHPSCHNLQCLINETNRDIYNAISQFISLPLFELGI